MPREPLQSLGHAYRLLNPGSVLWVSVGDRARDNLFALTWNMPLESDPPLVAILTARDHFSYPFIERTGELALNVPHADQLDALYGCGTTSGREVDDKFARFGLSREPARVIGVPLVAEAVASLECRVQRTIDVEGSALIIAEVVAACADPRHFARGVYQFDHGLALLHHLSGNRFCVSREVHSARRGTNQP